MVLPIVTGSDPDADGFTVSVTTRPPQSVNAGVAAVFADLPPGFFTVQLQNVASNCEVSGENPRMVSLAAAAVATVVYPVECIARGTGAVRAFVTTPGFSQFSVSVDDGPIWATTLTGGPIVVPDLAPGIRNVRLHIDERDCRISGANPAPVAVVADRVTDVRFSLSCPGGSLVVAVSTTGNNRPSAYTAYIVEMNDAFCYSYTCQAKNVPANGTVTFEELRVVPYYVTLRNVASNCVVTPASHSDVEISPTSQRSVAFAVACS